MTLTESEMNELTGFWSTHKLCLLNGFVKITQRPGGGIGIVTEVVCPCGEMEDITDYDRW